VSTTSSRATMIEDIAMRVREGLEGEIPQLELSV
jgi:hypothetical protein